MFVIPLEGGPSGSRVRMHWTSWLSRTPWARCAVCCCFDSYLLLLAVAVADFAPLYCAIAIAQSMTPVFSVSHTLPLDGGPIRVVRVN